MKCVYPDYNEGLLNLLASLRQYFHLDPLYKTHPDADRYLAEKPDNVFVLLIDAMGSKILERHLPEDSFLRSHMIREMTTVYPSTTAAATTIFSTGLAPVSSGWMGWMEYFKEVDDYRILFWNGSYYSHARHTDSAVQNALVLQGTLQKSFEAAGSSMRVINPKFDPEGVHSMEEMKDRILEYANTLHNTFTYAYWDEFDALMHEVGTEDPKTKKELCHIDDVVRDLAEQLPEGNLLFVIADHGQINTVTEDILTAHPDLAETLERRAALEARTVVLYVKPERRNDFEELFKTYYGDSFELYTSEEFAKIFMGEFPHHPRVKDLLGDYVAVAKGRKSLVTGADRVMVGDHAGLTEDEMMIPLIVYRKEGKKQ